MTISTGFSSFLGSASCLFASWLLSFWSFTFSRFFLCVGRRAAGTYKVYYFLPLFQTNFPVIQSSFHIQHGRPGLIFLGHFRKPERPLTKLAAGYGRKLSRSFLEMRESLSRVSRFTSFVCSLANQ